VHYHHIAATVLTTLILPVQHAIFSVAYIMARLQAQSLHCLKIRKIMNQNVVIKKAKLQVGY